MKLINKIVLCIGLLFLAGIISVFAFDDGKNSIYNDEQKISANKDNYTFEDKIEARISSNQIDMTYSGFSGMNTIWVIEVKEYSEIEFNLDSTVSIGEFKVVLINNQREIKNIVEGTEKGDKTIKLEKGKYIVKLVGRKAAGKINLSIHKNQNIDIIRVRN